MSKAPGKLYTVTGQCEVELNGEKYLLEEGEVIRIVEKGEISEDAMSTGSIAIPPQPGQGKIDFYPEEENDDEDEEEEEEE